jgi:HEAT repeat protein
VVPLIGRIQEPRAAIRRQAAAALGSLGDARAAGALTVALGDADSSVRAEAAVALGRLGASDAVWSLGALLAKETDSAVQNAIVDALGAIASDASATALVEALAYPHTPKRRGEAALARAGEAALPSLEACLFQNAQARAADSCVNALGAIGGERAGQLVMRALRQAVVPASTALGALGAIGDKQALPTVLEYLTSTKPA